LTVKETQSYPKHAHTEWIQPTHVHSHCIFSFSKHPEL